MRRPYVALATLLLCFCSAGSPAALAHSVTDVIPAYGNDIVVNPQTNRIYISSPEGGIAVVDGDTNRVLDTLPYAGALAINPEKNRLYAVTSQKVVAIDGGSHTLLNSVQTGSMDHPVHVAVHPGLNRLYVLHAYRSSGLAINGRMMVLDGETLSSVAEVTVPKYPRGIAVDPGLNRIYVTSAHDNSLTLIDGMNHRVIDTIPVASSPDGVVADSRTHNVYVHHGYFITLLREGQPQVRVQSAGGMQISRLALNPHGSGVLQVGHIDPSKPLDGIPYTTWSAASETFSSEPDAQPSLLYSLKISRTVDGPTGALTGLAANPNTGKVYVADRGSTKTLVLEDAPHVDTTPPVVTASIETEPNTAGWYKGMVTAAIHATDDQGGLGIHYIRFTSNCCAAQPRKSFTGFNETMRAPLEKTSLPEDEYPITYAAVDFAGNETHGKIFVKIDRLPPATSRRLSARPGGAAQVTLMATDRESGVVETLYQVDGGPYHPYIEPFTLDPDRPHTVRYYSRDRSGQAESIQTIAIRRSGDMDGNGARALEDVIALLRQIVSGLEPETPQDLIAGDQDGSGRLDVADAILLLRQLAGL